MAAAAHLLDVSLPNPECGKPKPWIHGCLWMRVAALSTLFAWWVVTVPPVVAEGTALRVQGKPAELSVRVAGECAVRVTLRPRESEDETPFTPALATRPLANAALQLHELSKPITQQIGKLTVQVRPNPLTVTVQRPDGTSVQRLTFDPAGPIRFELDDQPVLGLGEGGPRPPQGVQWRELPVEFDRRGRRHRMRPRWQADAYGSRNPVPLLIGAKGWALFVATPWGEIDLSDEAEGVYTPVAPSVVGQSRQSQANQHEHRGKGLPPAASLSSGAYDLFVFDAADPRTLMGDIATLTGKAALPPRWALGYMQSHRTLEDDAQMMDVVETFRKKRIPLDAVIYLGTGFTPRGWNTRQPSFQFNPSVFRRDPSHVLDQLHSQHVKVIVHMVPWDRDKLPTLEGSIPAARAAADTPGQLADYWRQHVPLVDAGIDAWWPDEGDWFNLFERMKRHELYYTGPLSTRPNMRPWSLHRNGHLGVARWGGWVWSGDTESSWKSLEAQIAVGLNHSLSLSPFWGSDIGGFFPTRELTGELYARWFQFGAFCPSFRSHGRTWWTRLPWGWGLADLGPLESRTPPRRSELNNHAIEPVVKKYAELRYRLLSYNYTLAWEARSMGMPMMRSMWLHYPQDATASKMGDQYLWGKDLLIAPVYQQGAKRRTVYLPDGLWYDWWTNEPQRGAVKIQREVDLATMPIYARAGAILPMDPLRQHTGEKVEQPITLRIYSGANGRFTLYEDDGQTMQYVDGDAGLTHCDWNDAARRLTITSEDRGRWKSDADRTFQILLLPQGATGTLTLANGAGVIEF